MKDVSPKLKLFFFIFLYKYIVLFFVFKKKRKTRPRKLLVDNKSRTVKSNRCCIQTSCDLAVLRRNKINLRYIIYVG